MCRILRRHDALALLAAGRFKGVATATAIVSAWTSRPIHRTLLMTGSFRMWPCVVQCSNSQRNPRAANRSRSFHCD